MKKIILILLVLLLCSEAHAYFYIFNSDNESVGRTQYLPDVSDLNSRNEFYVFSADDIPVDFAEYFQGSVRLRPKTKAEKDKEKEVSEIQQELDLVENKLRANAIAELKSEGVIFKHIDK